MIWEKNASTFLGNVCVNIFALHASRCDALFRPIQDSTFRNPQATPNITLNHVSRVLFLFPFYLCCCVAEKQNYNPANLGFRRLSAVTFGLRAEPKRVQYTVRQVRVSSGIRSPSGFCVSACFTTFLFALPFRSEAFLATASAQSGH